MRIIEPSVEFIDIIDGNKIIKKLERCGRICYKSEDLITDESSVKFINAIIKSGHETILEHVSITVIMITNRGVTHELVRHRIASYSQESSRYCNYSKGKFGSELTFIKPCFWLEDSEEYKIWKSSMSSSETYYLNLLSRGSSAQEAREVLPNSLKTEIVVTMNLREWRHFFKLRAIGTTGKPHPEMEKIALITLKMFKENIPIIFDDIK